MSDDPVKDLMSGGAPAISFADESMLNRWIKGTVTAVEKVQQTDFKTKAAKFYDDEKQRPMWQYVFTLATEDRDPADEDDDGVRRLYARAQMIGAIANALKKAGISDTPSALGGKLAVRWTGYGEKADGGMNPPKLYEARFQATDATADLAAEPAPLEPEPDPDTDPFN